MGVFWNEGQFNSVALLLLVLTFPEINCISHGVLLVYQCRKSLDLSLFVLPCLFFSYFLEATKPLTLCKHRYIFVGLQKRFEISRDFLILNSWSFHIHMCFTNGILNSSSVKKKTYKQVTQCQAPVCLPFWAPYGCIYLS